MTSSVLKSQFYVTAMDCPAEEELIRVALKQAAGIEALSFDLPKRKLIVWHTCAPDDIGVRLERLKLGAELLGTEESAPTEDEAAEDLGHRRVLRLLLAINATMFVVELVAGWLWQSTSLLSDSLDMLADASVYGISLWAVGSSRSRQHLAARWSGWLEMALAVGVLIEVLRSAISGSYPNGAMMMATAGVALVANVASVLLLAGHRDQGVHMRASWIFSTNDVIANLGVIAAGALVLWTSSRLPDLVMGTIIGFIVMRGAFRILAMSRDTETPEAGNEGSAAAEPSDASERPPPI